MTEPDMTNTNIQKPGRGPLYLLAGTILLLSFLLGTTILPLTAKEDANGANPSGADRMIGFLITTEHLDLFDMEGYLQDHLSDFSGGGDITLTEEDTSDYSGRLYATLKENDLTDPDTGEKITKQEYVFEDVDGIPFFYYTRTSQDTTTIYKTGDEAIVGQTSISSTAEGENIELTGTLYIPAGGQAEYYFNPVFQAADESIFATEGNGISFDADAEGMAVSHKQDWESTETASDGSAKINRFSVEVTVSVIDPPQSIAIVQMNAQNEVVLREEYAPDQIPGSIEPEADTSYIIVETHKKASGGSPAVSYTLFGQEDDYLEYFLQKDDICIRRSVQLMWK